MRSRNRRTTPRAARTATVAILLPPLVLAFQACESDSTAIPDPCPTTGKWALGGGSGNRLDPDCAWTGVIHLSHTESTDEKHEFVDPFKTHHLILGQNRHPEWHVDGDLGRDDRPGVRRRMAGGERAEVV